MAKLQALGRAIHLGRHGAGIRSQATLFCIGLLNQLDRRRIRARKVTHQILECVSLSSERLEFLVNIRKRPLTVIARLGDNADYQTIFECFGSMYKTPPFPIRNVLDCGANLGLFSLAASAKESVKEIIVVEPDKSNAAFLRRNLSALGGVKFVQAALAARDGRARFFRVSSNAGHLVDYGARGGELSFEVETRRISSVLPSHWDLAETWLKLDIEGAEYDVLNEMIKDNILPRVISAELHDYINVSGDRMVRRLQLSGYSIIIDGCGDAGYVCRQIYAVRE
jgi:FkbM family methyltransferase